MITPADNTFYMVELQAGCSFKKRNNSQSNVTYYTAVNLFKTCWYEQKTNNRATVIPRDNSNDWTCRLRKR